MKKNLIMFCAASFIMCPAFAQSQKTSKQKIGLKAGYNFSHITGSESGFDPNHNDGYMVSAFFSHAGKNGFGYRSELVYSKQGYSFDNGGKNTDVINNYLYMPHLMTFTIAKLLQLQAGGQVGVLLNAKKSTGNKDSTITNLMNRFDYGFAAGAEVYPFKGLIVGARYNLGLGKMYKTDPPLSGNPYPLPFDPATANLKNGLVQLFIGYRF